MTNLKIELFDYKKTTSESGKSADENTLFSEGIPKKVPT